MDWIVITCSVPGSHRHGVLGSTAHEAKSAGRFPPAWPVAYEIAQKGFQVGVRVYFK